MPVGQELQQSNATCETLDVRGDMNVGGTLTVDGLPVLPGGAILTDGVTIEGDGTLGNEVALKQVQTVADGNLAGDGSVALPLALGANLHVTSMTAAQFGDQTSVGGSGVLAIGGQLAAIQDGGGFGGDLFVASGISIEGEIHPASIGPGNVNNWNPVGLLRTFGNVYVTVDAAGANLTGIEATSTQFRVINLYNLGPGVLVVKHHNGGSIGGNQFECPGGVDLVIPPSYTFQVRRDVRGVGNAKLWVTAVGAPSGVLMGTAMPDDAGVVAPVGTRYQQQGTSVIWYKYGPNPYNWEPCSLDTSDGFVFHDDALSSLLVAGTGSAITGTATSSFQGGSPGHPGISIATVISNATPDRVRYFLLGGGNPLVGIVIGGGKIFTKTCIAFPVLSDGVNNFSYRGPGNDGLASADVTDGVYWENDLSVLGDNRWRLCAAKAGVRTKVDSGVLPVAAAFNTLRYVIAADGSSVKGMIDNTLVATINAPNLPVVGWGITHQLIKTLGAAGALSWNLDYTTVACLLTTPR